MPNELTGILSCIFHSINYFLSSFKLPGEQKWMPPALVSRHFVCLAVGLHGGGEILGNVELREADEETSHLTCH